MVFHTPEATSTNPVTKAKGDMRHFATGSLAVSAIMNELLDDAGGYDAAIELPRNNFRPLMRTILLHALMQGGGWFVGYRIINRLEDVKMVLDRDMQRLQRLGFYRFHRFHRYYDQVEDLAHSFASAYFCGKLSGMSLHYQLRSLSPPVPISLNDKSSWLANHESPEMRHMGALRYIAVSGDPIALKIGLRHGYSTIWPEWECAQPDGLISVAIAIASWSTLESIEHAGAEWIDCLHWAMHWRNPGFVDQIATEISRTYWPLGSQGGPLSKGPSWNRDKKPLSKAIVAGAEFVQALLRHGARPRLSDITFAIEANAEDGVVSQLIQARLGPESEVEYYQGLKLTSRDKFLGVWADLLLTVHRTGRYQRALQHALRFRPRLSRVSYGSSGVSFTFNFALELLVWAEAKQRTDISQLVRQNLGLSTLTNGTERKPRETPLQNSPNSIMGGAMGSQGKETLSIPYLDMR